MLEHTPHSTPPRPKDSRPRRSLPLGTPGRREIALFAGIYLLYDSARWIFVAHLPEARRHASWVIHLERRLHMALEARVQHLLAGGADGMLLSDIYLAAQLVVLPGALIWLYRRDREIYRRLRNTVVGTWLISTPVFALYPVAPPRLAGIGISDTVSHQAGVALTGHSTMFYNPYAAVPSLHAGLAVAIGISLAAAARPRWAKVVALAWGPLVALAVVATGNHYLFDVATGLLTVAVAYGLSRVSHVLPRPTLRHPGRPARRLTPEPARS